MRRALAIAEASFGSHHPNVAVALSNLARLLQDTNRLTDAEPLVRRALAIEEASYGSDHPAVAIRLWVLAGVLVDTDRLAEAVGLMHRAAKIFLKFTRDNGHPHRFLKPVVGSYRTLLMKIGDTPAQAAEKIDTMLTAYDVTLD